jgi:hypothetical protein
MVGMLAVSGLVGCAGGAQYVAPAPVPPRPAVAIAAPSDATWKAVLDQFAQDGITVASTEKDFGFIRGGRVDFPESTPEEREAARLFADCGRLVAPRRGSGSGSGGSGLYHPVSAEYTVVVRVSGGSSTVRASARFLGRADDQAAGLLVECVSTGRFESSFESAVKTKAEGARS